MVGFCTVGRGVGVGVGIGVDGSGVGVGSGVVVTWVDGAFVAVPHPALARDKTSKKIREIAMIGRMCHNRLFSSNTL
jgi:hypothetical protein